MAEPRTGAEVKALANDDSLPATEPVLLRSTIIGIVSAVLSILVLSGVVTGDERAAIEEHVGVIVPALLLLLPVLSGIWSRLAAYSPRSAARIAVTNAQQPAGAPPVIATTPP
jgi:hypothetical protein